MARHYIGDIVADAAEDARLGVLEGLYDPPTRTILREAGLREGQTVLELGPGRGSMLGFLCDAVGPSGHVVGVDQNARFLAHLKRPNLTVTEENFEQDPHVRAPFDLIYTRFVLMHLEDAAATVARMAALLRPGGRAVLLDIDFSSHVACDPAHPRSSAFDTHRNAIDIALRAANLTELDFGRRLPSLVAAAGLTLVSADYRAGPVTGGSPEAMFWRRNAEVTAGAAVEAGTLGRAALDVLTAYEDPSFRFLAPLLSVAVGERTA